MDRPGFPGDHKVPRYVWLRAEPLPRNASGKFLERELRDSLDSKAAPSR